MRRCRPRATAMCGPGSSASHLAGEGLGEGRRAARRRAPGGAAGRLPASGRAISWPRRGGPSRSRAGCRPRAHRTTAAPGADPGRTPPRGAARGASRRATARCPSREPDPSPAARARGGARRAVSGSRPRGGSASRCIRKDSCIRISRCANVTEALAAGVKRAGARGAPSAGRRAEPGTPAGLFRGGEPSRSVESSGILGERDDGSRPSGGIDPTRAQPSSPGPGELAVTEPSLRAAVLASLAGTLAGEFSPDLVLPRAAGAGVSGAISTSAPAGRARWRAGGERSRA